MIIEYSCSNFKSIGDEIRFSMVAGGDKSLKDNFYFYNDLNILKEATIYGANGSGKSNFIKSLILLKKLVINSTKLQPGDLLFIQPNKTLLDRNCEFQIHFISNNTRFLYGLGYNANLVTDEFLYYYPNNRVAKIFDRENGVITYGDSFKKSLSGVEKDFLKPNQLMLSAAALYRNIEEINDAFLFFNKDLVVYNNELDCDCLKRSLKNNNLKTKLLDFLRGIGNSNLVDININTNGEIKFNYTEYDLDLSEESSGNIKLINLFINLLDSIENDKVFIFDGFEASLHPLIITKLLDIFMEHSKAAQLIFTTHDINLLDLSILRRDQIWFTEAKKNGFTSLYSLAEIKSVRKDENVIKNYLLGKYGGIPEVNR